MKTTVESKMKQTNNSLVITLKHSISTISSKLTIFLLMTVFSVSISAQEVVEICGEYTYYAHPGMSPEQAKAKAYERTLIEFLGKKFGVSVGQNTHMSVEERNGQYSDHFSQINSSEVKGEWIEDNAPPEYTVRYQHNTLVIDVALCGKAREVTRAGVNFKAKILKNGTEAKFEDSEFKNKDDLYLLFQSPVKGYLAIYLVDDAQTAFCLLPYREDKRGIVEIEGGKEYVFFSTKHVSKEEAKIVDEMELHCEKEVEYNQIFIIFSTREFAKALDKYTGRKLDLLDTPRELPFAEFQKWLTHNRLRDPNMQVDRRSITIKK